MQNHDIRAKTTLEQDTSDLLRSLEEEPHDAAYFTKLLKAASQYVYPGSDITDYQNYKFKGHQLCSKCETDRGREDPDAERERWLRFRLQTCMLQSVTFRSRPNRSVERWLKGLFNTFTSCIDCYKGYLRIKRDIGPM